MKVKTHHLRPFVIVFLSSALMAWLILPRAIRRAIEPHALAAATTFTVNVTGDGSDANQGDAVCATGAGNCSLRAAIEEANANSGKDTINFNIPGAGVHTISPGTGLPTITQAVVIDGYSQPGASPNTLADGDNAVLLIELSGINVQQSNAGLDLNANSSTVTGLVINLFSDEGISLRGIGNTIQGNFIGTEPTGTSAQSNVGDGIFIEGGEINNVIGGTTPAARNIISGNRKSGIFINGAGQQINGNVIEGNFIGTTASGTSALGNVEYGVFLLKRQNETIGGTSPGAGNVISGNIKTGVRLTDTSNSVVQGNKIGTDVNGTAALPNAESGVLIDVFDGISVADTIGGPTTAARNIISGNASAGVEIIGTQEGGTVNKSHIIQNNYIGTDITGNAALGNGFDGILLEENGFSPGGPSANIIGNLIADNSRFGILLDGDNCLVQQNLIGTDASGQNPLGSQSIGVFIEKGATNISIGGPVGTGNTIAFNSVGVRIVYGGTTGDAILSNAIFSNSSVGIDLSSDNVTANDLGDTDTGPNNLQNFPVVTSASTNGSNTIVNGSFDGSPNATITVQFFANTACDPSGNGEGQTFVGSINRTTGGDGHFMFSTTLMTNVPSGQFITTTATDAANNTSEFSQCVQVTGSSSSPNTVQFGQSFYSVFEDCTAVTLTVAREGDTSTTATVDYASQSGSANDHSDFNTAIGTLTFEPGETAKSFEVLISEDSYVENTEAFTVTLSNPSGATLGSPAATTVDIFDDPPEPPNNPIESADDFVCQHYHDFLNREDDSIGLAFWTNNITSCDNDAACIQRKRVDTSAAFFLSIEFQETGGFAIRVQRTAFGKKSVTASSRISYRQFIHDARFVGDGVVVGQPGFDTRLEANKQAYVNQVVTSAAFMATYTASVTADQFVDALFASAGVTPTSTERQNAINAFGGGGTSGRTAALRSVSDSNSLRTVELSPSFVLMQYFGYLRRNPTEAPDNNDNGYQFWLTKLNNFNGDYNRAEMVKAFITSGEYRSRFGAP